MGKTENEKKKNSSKKRSKTGFIFWLAFALIIIIAFVVAKGKIATVLKETDFFNEVTGSESKAITDLVESSEKDLTIEKNTKKAKKSKSEKKKAKSESEIIPLESEKRDFTERTENSDISVLETENSTEKTVGSEKVQNPTAPTENAKNTQTDKTESAKKAEEVSVPKKMMNLNLCFVQIDDSGSIIRRETIRSVEKNDSPLTTAINLLLSGPNADEIRKGYISVIPANSKLLSAKITGKTAILNFNEDFAFNSYGVQGQIAQLSQIVYTATSFSTIDNVQILIDGSKIEYLGGEGVWIGSPLSRFSF